MRKTYKKRGGQGPPGLSIKGYTPPVNINDENWDEEVWEVPMNRFNSSKIPVGNANNYQSKNLSAFNKPNHIAINVKEEAPVARPVFKRSWSDMIFGSPIEANENTSPTSVNTSVSPTSGGRRRYRKTRKSKGRRKSKKSRKGRK
jgi:hypothetical protein